jgi:hypothetical protein
MNHDILQSLSLIKVDAAHDGRGQVHAPGWAAHLHCRVMSSLFIVMQRFRPMTVERPKVLLPLVNVPMINYTLEWLIASGVDEVGWQLRCTLHVYLDAHNACGPPTW